jgi:hypothetical protein
MFSSWDVPPLCSLLYISFLNLMSTKSFHNEMHNCEIHNYEIQLYALVCIHCIVRNAKYENILLKKLS